MTMFQQKFLETRIFTRKNKDMKVKYIEQTLQSIYEQNKGNIFSAKYEITGLSELVKSYIDDFDQQPEYINSTISKLGLDKYLYDSYKENKYPHVYLKIDLILGDASCGKICSSGLMISAKWYDIESNQIHKTSTCLSQKEYFTFLSCVELKRLSDETML